MPQPSRRDHLIETAITLFCERGFHATGIDLLLETAGMSKKTMYQYFRSKDELIYAALRHHDGVFRNGFMKAVEAAGATPQEKLLAVFDVADTWFGDNNFFGCMFINAVGEYSEKESPIREIGKQFKQMMRNYVVGLTKEIGVLEHEALADEICLLLEGAIVTAQVSGTSCSAQTARKAAQSLISVRIH